MQSGHRQAAKLFSLRPASRSCTVGAILWSGDERDVGDPLRRAEVAQHGATDPVVF